MWGVCAKAVAIIARHYKNLSKKTYVSILNEDVPNIPFNTAAGMYITSRAVGALEFLAKDLQYQGSIAALKHVRYVPNQPHNLLSVSQLTKQQTDR